MPWLFFVRCPQELPISLLKHINMKLLDAWCELREVFTMGETLETYSDTNEDMGLSKSFRMAEQAVSIHAFEIENIFSMLRGISGAKTLAVTFLDPVTSPYAGGNTEVPTMMGKFEMDDKKLQPREEIALRHGIGLGLMLSGSILIRQHLAFRVLGRNDQGEMEWQHQERIWCFSGWWGNYPSG